MSTDKLYSGPIKYGNIQYVSRKKKVEGSVNTDLVLLLSRTIKAQIIVDFNYHSKMHNLEHFVMTWSFIGLLCSVKDHKFIFSDKLE